MPTLLIENIEDLTQDTQATSDGLVGVGGKLTAKWLLHAYKLGIFPWFNDGDPVLWWSPDPRMVLVPSEFKVSKSFRNILNRAEMSVTYNSDFEAIINNCGNIERAGQPGTWITDDMKLAYLEMHKLGWAHSLEVWKEDVLVGGLYGIAMGKVFFGESMYSISSNASKFALYSLCKELDRIGFKAIDCQVYTSHLESLGAKNISREQFQEILLENIGEEKLDLKTKD